MGTRAQDKAWVVAVTVDGVRSSDGRVTGSLCNDPAKPYCSTYVARAKAVAGRTGLRFEGVAPGRYSLSIVHDENGNGRTEIPPEGYAFGNNSPTPSFDQSSIVVEGNVVTSLSLTYPGAVRLDSHGVEPPDGVERIDVRDNGLYGELYVPKQARTPLPALILIGGSDGGLDSTSALAPPFALDGYATLAVAYFAERGLPRTLEDIPLEYFDTAVAWLRARPGIDAGAIGVVGDSRGAEAALLLAARNPAVHAVVAIAPSDVVWGGYNAADPSHSRAAWTAGGVPLPSLPVDVSLYASRGSVAALSSALIEADAHPEAAIRVERIDGPVLLISGQDDAVWPSATMANRIAARLSRVRFGHDVENLVYPGAGHQVFAGNADAWVHTRAFLHEALTSRQ